MPINIKDAKKGTGGVIAPAGAHLARCYSLVDLGTHTTDGKYGKKTNRKLRFSWELPEAKHVFDEKRGPEPFAVHYILNFTAGPKSSLIKMLTSWRGKPFKPEELEDFDLKKVLGKACMITVMHTDPDVNGNVYANVDNVSPVPSRWREQMPSPINRQVYYEVEQGKNATFDSFPEWLQKLIGDCEEWAAAKPKVTSHSKHVGDPSNEPPDEIFGEKEEETEEEEEKDSDPF
jgi:hypothetical protein